MNLNLSESRRKYLEELVAEGIYACVEDALEDALVLLEEREEGLKLEAIRGSLVIAESTSMGSHWAPFVPDEAAEGSPAAESDAIVLAASLVQHQISAAVKGFGRREQAQAARLMRRLRSARDALAEMPTLGAQRPEIGPGVRSLQVLPYVLFYIDKTEGPMIRVFNLIDQNHDLRARRAG